MTLWPRWLSTHERVQKDVGTRRVNSCLSRHTRKDTGSPLSNRVIVHEMDTNG